MSPPIRGRGVPANPANRFTRLELEPDPEAAAEEAPLPRTVFLDDTSRSIISTNDSPDVGFDASINPYRGCEHGCAYCYARPTHEYLGLSAGLDFEQKILVKRNAPELLRRELAKPGWTPKTLAVSGVTDPYQPVERRLRITRGCVEVLHECRHPLVVVTKNHLVTRDADLLADLASRRAAYVCLSVTTLDPELARRLEPRTSTPRRRLDAVRALSDAGVPVGVMIAPVIPGLTDHEMPAILRAAADAGARSAAFVMLRLPHGVAPLFEDWLNGHAPDRASRVLNRVREVRGGRMNDARFGSRMRGEGTYAAQVRGLFQLACRKAGLAPRHAQLSTESFRRPPGPQLTLW